MNKEQIADKAINLDWLEVYCIEDGTKNAAYYRALGWTVAIREYGTPIYKEMFTLMGSNGKPFLEIRRNPYSDKEKGGILEHGACHIRLANRTCYLYNAVELLRTFLLKYNYNFKGISRVDIACDQIVFDSGITPEQLIAMYMRGKILKSRNSNINVHGSELAYDRAWNSIKWGSENSAVSTKIYNKTLELKQKSDKLYIKDCWVKEGLCDLQKVTYEYYDKKSKEKTLRSKMVCVKKGTAVENEIPIEEAQEVNIWRVEYSIKTEGRTWVDVDNEGNKLTITLSKFDTKTKQTLVFLLLSNWLMNFVYYETTKTGAQKRKDRCERVVLYTAKNIEKVYKPKRITEKEDPTRTQRILYNRLFNMAHSTLSKLSDKDKQKCDEVAKLLASRHGNYWLPDVQLDAEKLKQIKAESDAGNMLIANLDTFEALDWLQPYLQGEISPEQRKFIDEHKRDFVKQIVFREQMDYHKYRRKMEYAQSQIDFWQGKTMETRVKDIIFGIPLAF